MILKKGPKIVKNGLYICFSEHCHGNMCNLNVIVLLEFISKDLYFSPQSCKIQFFTKA